MASCIHLATYLFRLGWDRSNSSKLVGNCRQELTAMVSLTRGWMDDMSKIALRTQGLATLSVLLWALSGAAQAIPNEGQASQAASLGAGPAPGAGPFSGAGPMRGAGPAGGPNDDDADNDFQQASRGPLQGGPLQNGGPLQGSGPIQTSGPLQSGGPMQTNGPLQNSGPLQAASPLQNTAPDGGLPGGLESLISAGDPLIPPPDGQYYAGAYGPVDGKTMQQLIAERLGVPGGASGPTLVSLVNSLTPPDPPPPPVTPVVNPPLPPTPVPPGPLPPVIYDPPPPQQQSPR